MCSTSVTSIYQAPLPACPTARVLDHLEAWSKHLKLSYQGIQGLSYNVPTFQPFSAAAPKYQILEPREGYIPVYIRYGDEPLSEINPALAAAFHEPVNRVSRAELAQVLQRDESPNNTSSNSTSISAHSALSASDEHRIALAVAAERARAAKAAAAEAANKV